MKRSLAYGGLLLASVGFALLLAEILLRFMGAPTGGVFTVSQGQFQEVPGIFEPKQRVRITTIPALEHTVTINPLGYRGQDFPREKEEGEVRILFVGDSFVFGDYVEDDETLPAQLERLLRSECPSVRVVNMGLGGSTITEHIRLLRRAYALDPDLVILLFSSNDVSDLRGTTMWEELERNRKAKSGFPLSVAYPLVRRSALWHVLLRVRGRLRAFRRAAPDQAAAAGVATGPGSDLSGLLSEYAGLLEQITEELKAKEIPHLFTAFPSHHSVSGTDPLDIDRWILTTVSEMGVPTVKLLPHLQASSLGAEALYLLPYDGHPSPTGYEVAAEAVGAKIQAMPFISGACSED